ncbi:hypothetical protein NDU88_010226 [Pleurodeles waltl]|uniref:Uncharacterized protein n=4 Tax=Pleurodeles waltl TaxID=8319 RepID=A0AAV7S002_PLEWA|nr:hypothetical protein NDU88_010226 [Pleurodeles waltl]
MNVDLEDKVDEQKDDTLLETCKEHLEIIFLYWEPTFQSVSTNLPARQDGIKESQEETVGLVCTTAYVVVKWVLKCMATHTINWQNVFEMLQWLKTKILPHGAVTDEILRDCGLKSVLFKIYNQVNNAGCMKTLNFAALHLFNTVMIQLLEAQGTQQHRFHETLKELCQRAANVEDDKKKAALVFLVSVYIGDMWLLAQDTEKFMIHVRAVCEATNEKSAGRKEKSPKGKRQKQSEEAIVIVCKEISAVTLLQ